MLTFQLYASGGKKPESIFKWKLDVLGFKGQADLITNKIKKGDSPCLAVRIKFCSVCPNGCLPCTALLSVYQDVMCLCVDRD